MSMPDYIMYISHEYPAEREQSTGRQTQGSEKDRWCQIWSDKGSSSSVQGRPIKQHTRVQASLLLVRLGRPQGLQ